MAWETGKLDRSVFFKLVVLQAFGFDFLPYLQRFRIFNFSQMDSAKVFLNRQINVLLLDFLNTPS